MLETINRKPDIDIYNINGLVLEDIQGDIELKDVYFIYLTRLDVGKRNPWALNFRCQNCSIRFICLMDFFLKVELELRDFECFRQGELVPEIPELETFLKTKLEELGRYIQEISLRESSIDVLGLEAYQIWILVLLDCSNRFSVGETSVKMIFEFILFLGIIDLEKSDKWIVVLEISYRKLEE